MASSSSPKSSPPFHPLVPSTLLGVEGNEGVNCSLQKLPQTQSTGEGVDTRSWDIAAPHDAFL